MSGLVGEVYNGDFGGIAGLLLPTAFAELRSWWNYEELPAAGSASGSLWPARAGTQATSLAAGATVARSALYSGAPEGSQTTFGNGTSTPAWTQVDGLTYFVVTQISGSGILFLMTTNNPPTPRQFALYIDGSNLSVAKQDGSGLNTGITNVGRVGLPMSWVVSFGQSPGNVVRVRAKVQGSAMQSFETTNAVAFGSPAGMNLNGTSGGTGWARTIVDAGVIGRVLGTGEMDALCLANAARFGF